MEVRASECNSIFFRLEAIDEDVARLTFLFSLLLPPLLRRVSLSRLRARQILSASSSPSLLRSPSSRERPNALLLEKKFPSVVVVFVSQLSIMTWTGVAPVAPPPGYDPSHPERDPVGAAAAREAAARASAVRVEKAKVRYEIETKINRPSPASSFALFSQPRPSLFSTSTPQKTNSSSARNSRSATRSLG